jgi:hypothetical protein
MLFYWEPDNPIKQDEEGRAVDDELMNEQQYRFWFEAYDLLRPHLARHPHLYESLFRTHLLHTQVFLQSWRWRTAEAELLRALRLKPHHPQLKKLLHALQQRLPSSPAPSPRQPAPQKPFPQ